ncbi:CD276 antigen [Anabarilius grahami]|uniref:CD276 antigen n=1 Tax=Anabarilius grahami TaxID=495550 RepID=A0A3N0Z337_ANAGA|nr:CD276 antigen [Anabarilius grahami]
MALFGMDTVLNCSFSGASEFNLSDLSVFWQLSDTKRTVHSYWLSQDQLIDQDDRFANRTSLYPDQLMAGNVSLLLKKVRVADEGSYTCFVKVQTYSSGAMLMQVAAPFSKPLVTWGTESNLKPGDVVALTCLAYGGYPEAQVLWQDGAGRNLTDNVTISQVANEEGLFSVKSFLTVILEPNSTYNCRLTNPLLGEEGQASVTITVNLQISTLSWCEQRRMENEVKTRTLKDGETKRGADLRKQRLVRVRAGWLFQNVEVSSLSFKQLVSLSVL